jgi:dimethylargininase
MAIAITRNISSSISNCELTFLSRQKIDISKAIEQHLTYKACLTQLGAQVITLPTEPQFPDEVFIEDTAIVVDELAVITRMGTPTRRLETRAVSEFLVKYRPLKYIISPSTIEGGDVIRTDRTLYVGISGRTNEHGVMVLRNILAPYDYRVIAVHVNGCRHLSTGCSYIDHKTMLANTSWVDTSQMAELEVIEAPKTEPWAANVVKMGEVILMPNCFPQTQRLIEDRGFRVKTLDISEFQKAEGGLSSLSIRMNVVG